MEIQTVTHKVDLVGDSLKGLAGVAFPESRSRNFKFALNIAQNCSKYQAQEIQPGKPWHFCIFTDSPPDITRLLSLLKYAKPWKGTEVFFRGLKIYDNDIWLLRSMLHCYLDSSACNDPKAHCQEVLPLFPSNQVSFSISFEEIRKMPEPKKWLSSCKRVSRNGGWRPNSGHPASLKDQFQAEAVRVKCHHCPRFSNCDVSVLKPESVLWE